MPKLFFIIKIAKCKTKFQRQIDWALVGYIGVTSIVECQGFLFFSPKRSYLDRDQMNYNCITIFFKKRKEEKEGKKKGRRKGGEKKK